MKLAGIEPQNVFKYFEELSAIPRGSGNMEKISEYCLEFAQKNNLRAVRDNLNNVVIYKNGSKGYENSEPIILQGHLDMVCQKTAESLINFDTDGLSLFSDGEFIRADGTTLGADNGIAVAMIMAILSSDVIEHPPIEAVFTTDEETGMYGAIGFSKEYIKGKRMINIDSEDPDKVTVSCAGGFEFRASFDYIPEEFTGEKCFVRLFGLKGGHSGADIDKLRINANILMCRVMSSIADEAECRIISVKGGDKGNVIPSECIMEIACKNSAELQNKLETTLKIIKNEIKDREEDFAYSIDIDSDVKNYRTADRKSTEKIMMLLSSTPDGIISMSAEITGLVETSSNLGILKVSENKAEFLYTLRSNKKSAMDYLEEKMKFICDFLDISGEACGHYPPWEYNPSSKLEKIYIECFKNVTGAEPMVCAIHAGLECGVFAGKINDFDCISVGPLMHDIHTVNERLSIESTEKFYKILLEILKKLH